MRTLSLALFAIATAAITATAEPPPQDVAVASAPAISVADAGSTPAPPYQADSVAQRAAVADSGAGATDKAGTSRAILWGTLALIAAAIGIVWILNRRRNKSVDDYAYRHPQSGASTGSASDTERHRPQRSSPT